MYDLLVAAYLFKEHPSFNMLEAIQRFFHSPKVVVVSEPPEHKSLDQVLLEQKGDNKQYTLDQVKALLVKPYMHLDSKTADAPEFIATYDDLVSRGKVIKFALTKFSADSLREMDDPFKDYLLEIIVFQLTYTEIITQEFIQDLEQFGKRMENLKE